MTSSTPSLVVLLFPFVSCHRKRIVQPVPKRIKFTYFEVGVQDGLSILEFKCRFRLGDYSKTLILFIYGQRFWCVCIHCTLVVEREF